MHDYMIDRIDGNILDLSAGSVFDRMRRLDNEEEAVFEMIVFEGLSIEDVADTLDISCAKVRKIYRRAAEIVSRDTNAGWAAAS